jgi:prevent-host-death family protein
MTRTGHDETMTAIKISDLKARLSEHLRSVRRGGSLTVLDRDTPVARIVPIPGAASLQVRPPRTGIPPGRVKLPRPSRIAIDVLELLAEERGDR